MSNWFKTLFPGPVNVPMDLRAGAYQQITDDSKKQRDDDEYESNIYQEIHAQETDKILRIADSYDENDSRLYFKKFSFSYYHNTSTKPYFFKSIYNTKFSYNIEFC